MGAKDNKIFPQTLTTRKEITRRIGIVPLANPFILAPMSGITDRPMRLIAKRFGCGLACGEMVSANSLVRGISKSKELISVIPEERPLSLQIFGSDPDIMAEAARIVAANGVDILDINMGCAVRKVVKTGSGAALLKDPDRAERIVAAVRRAVEIPLTVKIRAGWDQSSLNFLHYGEMAQDAGADAVILHARTASQGFSGDADWRMIAGLREKLRIPVIGNGDVTTGFQALEMMEQTGCDAVMIGRAARGNPWIFREALCLINRKDPPPINPSEVEAIMKEHMDLAMAKLDPDLPVYAFRKHLAWYSKGIDNSTKFRKKIFTITDRREIRKLIDDLFNYNETS